MKKTLIALAALAATGAAMAQSAVTIYGVIDQAFTRTNISGGTNKNEMVSSGNVTNRLGFRGTEDLGGGLKAKFQIETSLAADEPGATSIGDRGAWVAIAGDAWGEIRLGREYNPTFWNPIAFSPFGTNGSGRTLAHSARPLAFGGAGYTGGVVSNDPYIRNSNTINYILPSNLGGVYGSFQYAVDEKSNAYDSTTSPVTVTRRQGETVAFRLGYKDGPLDVALAYGTLKDKDPVSTQLKARKVNSTNLGASYDFGVAKLMGSWYQEDVKDGGFTFASKTIDKLTGYEIGVIVPFGPGNFRAAYGNVKFDAINGSDPKADKYAIGYVYPMSKRTSLYTTYARVSNKNGANLITNGTTGAQPGRSVSGVDFGITHTF